jgi:hypothetical protein
MTMDGSTAMGYGRRAIVGVALGMAVIGCSSSGGSSSAPSVAVPSVAASAAASGIMANGQFHDVDGMASGEAQLVVKPDGTYEVVLESFKTPSIEHINLVLVANQDVTKTADVDKTKLLDLGPLKSTEGMQDFVIPPSMAGGVMAGYHSVVIWDTAMAHAIGAAPLR